MNNSIKKLKLATIISFIIFVVYTLAIKFVLVAPIGPNDTNVGLAPLNKAVDDMLGLNMTIDKFTDIFLYAAILLAFCLGLYALRQAIEGKSLMKIDKGVFWTLLFYVMVIVVYCMFELIKINYRPVIIEGELEYSYPSSHTMIILCILVPMMFQTSRLLKNKTMIIIAKIVCIIMMFLTVGGRILSGMHWFTDIVGGILISVCLIFVYALVLNIIDEKSANKQDNK